MRITTFASGSGGNCALVQTAGASVLIDAGISLRRITSCLRDFDLAPESLTGVLITHDHSDHVSGLLNLAKRLKAPVFVPRGTVSHLCGMYPDLEDYIEPFRTGEALSLGDMSVTAFPTMHDAPGSVGYRLDCPEGSIGFCTDLGTVTDEVKTALCGVNAAVIESNHDEEMLRFGSYPVYLKRRILSEYGHLSNDSAAQLALFLAENGAVSLILAHLSRENNTPELALSASRKVLGGGFELQAALPFGYVGTEVKRCSP